MANKLMALFLICISLWLCDNFMRIAGIYALDANYYFKPIYYSFAFGPLLFFYVKSIVNSEFHFRKVHVFHFIPVLFQAGLYLYLVCSSYAHRHWYWQEVHLPFTYRLEFDGTFISLAVYLFFSIKMLMSYQNWLKEKYSEVSSSSLNWLKIILILMLLLTVQWFVEVILRDVFEDYYTYTFTPLILGVLTLVLAYRAFMQDDQREITFQPESTELDNPSFSFDPDILAQITKRMEEDRDYLEPKLSLKSFAKNCKLPQKTVSQYLNQKLNMTFHDYVNGHRIEAFKKMVISKEEQNMTLEGMAYDCGFNSKATFNRIFKKKTGITPSQFVSKQVKN